MSTTGSLDAVPGGGSTVAKRPDRPFPGFGTADAALVAVAVVWGASFTVIKHAYEQIPALPFLGLRFLIAGVSMLPFLLARRAALRVREARIAAVLIGALGVAGYQILFSVGLQYTAASKSTLLVATSPLWTAAFAALWGQVRPTRGQWLGMALALAGVALLTAGGPRGVGVPVRAPLLGDALTLAAGAVVGAAMALSERHLRAADGAAVMAAALVVGAILIQPLTWRSTAAFPWGDLGLRAWAELLYAALVAGSWGYAVWYRNVSRVGAVRGSLYGFLIPLVGVVSAVAVLGDRMTAPQAGGAALVLLGIATARGWLRPLARRAN